MIVEGATIAEIAENFSHDLGAPILDRTGLIGKFDFTMNPEKYVEDMRAKVRGMPGPIDEGELKVILMQNILEGDLGLRLEARHMAVDVLVIDHADKRPVEN